jgi:predicted metal-binding protein
LEQHEIVTATRPEAPIIVSVCVACRAKGAPLDASPGPALRADIEAGLLAQGIAASVRPVQCLSVCQRPVTVAVAAADGFTFFFGDLEGAEAADALCSFVGDYATRSHGFVPWKARPALLRAKIIARLPPPGWSPSDGRAPDQPAKEPIA